MSGNPLEAYLGPQGAEYGAVLMGWVIANIYLVVGVVASLAFLPFYSGAKQWYEKLGFALAIALLPAFGASFGHVGPAIQLGGGPDLPGIKQERERIAAHCGPQFQYADCSLIAQDATLSMAEIYARKANELMENKVKASQRLVYEIAKVEPPGQRLAKAP